MNGIIDRLVNMPPASRRAVALLMAGTMLLLAMIAMSRGIGILAERSADLTRKRELLWRMEQIAARAPALRAQGSEPSGETAMHLRGETEALARADLQAKLSDLAARSGVNVLSAGNTPSFARDGTRYVGIRLDVSAAATALYAALAAIESSEPPLIVRKLSSWTNNGSGADGAPMLTAQVEVYGALTPEAAGRVP